MDTSNTIEKIRLGLQTCSQDTGIPYTDLRIRISVDEGFISDSVKFSILQKTEFRRDIDICTLLGINKLEEILVSKFLSKTLKTMAGNENPKVKITDINARIFTRDENFTPAVCLFEKNRKIREITIEELL